MKFANVYGCSIKIRALEDAPFSFADNVFFIVTARGVSIPRDLCAAFTRARAVSSDRTVDGGLFYDRDYLL